MLWVLKERELSGRRSRSGERCLRRSLMRRVPLGRLTAGNTAARRCVFLCFDASGHRLISYASEPHGPAVEDAEDPGSESSATRQGAGGGVEQQHPVRHPTTQHPIPQARASSVHEGSRRGSCLLYLQLWTLPTGVMSLHGIKSTTATKPAVQSRLSACRATHGRFVAPALELPLFWERSEAQMAHANDIGSASDQMVLGIDDAGQKDPLSIEINVWNVHGLLAVFGAVGPTDSARSVVAVSLVELDPTRLARPKVLPGAKYGRINRGQQQHGADTAPTHPGHPRRQSSLVVHVTLPTDATSCPWPMPEHISRPWIDDPTQESRHAVALNGGHTVHLICIARHGRSSRRSTPAARKPFRQKEERETTNNGEASGSGDTCEVRDSRQDSHNHAGKATVTPSWWRDGELSVHVTSAMSWGLGAGGTWGYGPVPADTVLRWQRCFDGEAYLGSVIDTRKHHIIDYELDILEIDPFGSGLCVSLVAVVVERDSFQTHRLIEVVLAVSLGALTGVVQLSNHAQATSGASAGEGHVERVYTNQQRFASRPHHVRSVVVARSRQLRESAWRDGLVVTPVVTMSTILRKRKGAGENEMDRRGAHREETEAPAVAGQTPTPLVWARPKSVWGASNLPVLEGRSKAVLVNPALPMCIVHGD